MIKALSLILTLIISHPVLADTLTGKVVKITDGDTVHILQTKL